MTAQQCIISMIKAIFSNFDKSNLVVNSIIILCVLSAVLLLIAFILTRIAFNVLFVYYLRATYSSVMRGSYQQVTDANWQQKMNFGAEMTAVV